MRTGPPSSCLMWRTPPSKMTSASTPTRPVRWAATRVAQLPVPQAMVTPGRRSRSGNHLGKFNVAAIGELGIYFQNASPLFKLNLFDVIHKDHCVRVTHGNRLGGKIKAVRRELDRAQEVSRFTHIHANAAIVQKRRLHQPALGMQIKDILSRLRKATADNIFRHAARRIAAHGRFGAVGIKDAHFEIDAVCHRLRDRTIADALKTYLYLSIIKPPSFCKKYANFTKNVKKC